MNENQVKDVILQQNTAFRLKSTKLVRRHKMNELEALKRLPQVLVVSGIRRSGKSTLLKLLAEEYAPDDYYYFHFEHEALLDFKAADFPVFHQLLIETLGERNIFFLDEIQNIPHWEVFVRRLQDQKKKFFITGSNASLLSSELGTRLTGRNISLELFPFSFAEYLDFKKVQLTEKDLAWDENKALIQKHFQVYAQKGGMPEYLVHQEKQILLNAYDDILYRDILLRHPVDIHLLREISLYCLSNCGNLISYNKLKNIFKLGSVNTLQKYIQYLEDCYLLFSLRQYSHSLKKQMIAPKKIYAIDPGLQKMVSFQHSPNLGSNLENIIFLQLRQKHKDLYYYHTQSSREIDFAVREGNQITQLIQVCWEMNNPDTRAREIQALLEAMEETKLKTGVIVTSYQKETIKHRSKTIQLIPAGEFCLFRS